MEQLLESPPRISIVEEGKGGGEEEGRIEQLLNVPSREIHNHCSFPDSTSFTL